MNTCPTNIEVSPAADRHVRHWVQSVADPSAVRQMDEPAWRTLSRRLLQLEEIESPQYYADNCWEPTLYSCEGHWAGEWEHRLLGTARRVTWPEGKRFAVCLTHDVDHLRPNLFVERARGVVAHHGETLTRRLRLAASGFRHLARWPRNGKTVYSLSSWLDEEMRYGFRSTLFFLPMLPIRPHFSDGLYRPSDLVGFRGKQRPVSDVIRELAREGWDVGIHGSIESATNLRVAAEERERLCEMAGVEITSGRQHYLTYRSPLTARIHEAIGVRADSSLGSNVTPVCYRCGLGLPYPMYDHGADRPMNLIQVPLIAQDNPLLAAAGFDIDRATEMVVTALRAAAERGSMLTLLFHTNHSPESPCFQLYRRTLAAAAELGAWGCSVEQARCWLLNRLKRQAA
ncbi:MAG: hypothetical protein AB7F89_02270 [Pirellulaceae bacterium]